MGAALTRRIKASCIAWHDDGFTSSSTDCPKLARRLATGTGVDSVSAMQCTSATASPSSAAGDTYCPRLTPSAPTRTRVSQMPSCDSSAACDSYFPPLRRLPCTFFSRPSSHSVKKRCARGASPGNIQPFYPTHRWVAIILSSAN